MKVRLTSKLANKLDGVDVSRVRVGDIVDLPDADAAVLIRERWAEPVVTSQVNPQSEAKLHKSRFAE